MFVPSSSTQVTFLRPVNRRMLSSNPYKSTADGYRDGDGVGCVAQAHRCLIHQRDAGAVRADVEETDFIAARPFVKADREECPLILLCVLGV